MPLLPDRNAGCGIGAIEPCLPSPPKAAPSSPRLPDIKHDCFRPLAGRDSADVRLLSRKANDSSRCFRSIALQGRPVARIKARNPAPPPAVTREAEEDGANAPLDWSTQRRVQFADSSQGLDAARLWRNIKEVKQ